MLEINENVIRKYILKETEQLVVLPDDFRFEMQTQKSVFL